VFLSPLVSLLLTINAYIGGRATGKPAQFIGRESWRLRMEHALLQNFVCVGAGTKDYYYMVGSVPMFPVAPKIIFVNLTFQ
jgi:hypothetical protein